MKTHYELQFEELVTAMIISEEASIQDHMDRFVDFHRNSREYYDSLCDCLYILSSGRSEDSLWLTSSGQPYLSLAQRRAEDRLLLSVDQIPQFQDDLTDQLETALVSLRELSNKPKFSLDFVSTM